MQVEKFSQFLKSKVNDLEKSEKVSLDQVNLQFLKPIPHQNEGGPEIGMLVSR
jgi:hypothetical protein